MLLLSFPAVVHAQAERDRIDITGRQNLTLGSGARAYGMGGAFLACADDSTAASWNPAGLSYLRLPEISLVGASTSIKIVNSSSTNPQDFEKDHFSGQPTIDFAAFTWPVALGTARGAVQFSYQRAISFDGDRDIESYDAEGLWRRDNVHSDGGFDVLALGTGVRLAGSLRAGLTINRWLNGYDQALHRTLLRRTNRPIRDFQLAFDPRGWSFNLGLIWSPAEALSLGAVYKTPFSAKVRLGKSRRDSWVNADADIPDQISTNEFTSDRVRLEFPSSFGVGLSWRPRETLTLSADITRTRWSVAQLVDYFDLEPTGPTDPDGVPATKPPPVVYPLLQYPTQSAVPESEEPDDPVRLAGQQHAEQIRLGAEWVLIKGAIRIPLRAGYYSDRQIQRSRAGDVPRYNGFTAGVGVALGSVLLDVAYVYEHGSDAVVTETLNTEAPASTGANAAPPPSSVTNQRVFASVIYRFGSRN